jgi:hypothetical protein
MPHFFIKLPPDSPNPGRWTHARVHEVCERHSGKLEHFWHDDPANPGTAYALVENGDADGISAELHAHETLALHRPA